MAMVLVGAPFETNRDSVSQLLAQAPTLRALGLPEKAVFQADTVESPAMRPFLVVRWAEEEDRVGQSRVRPFDLWGYDELGDYNRITMIVREAARYLVEECFHVVAKSGSISQFVDRGIGGDLADDGFNSVVKPYRMAAIGRGV
ncbi:hypothetical protein SEA_TINYMINY_24 [Microbacterium phage TinyMiny]|nr:hypothetical protein SEA_TINYMINY_24 [Microbacterium phage TinyMiny]